MSRSGVNLAVTKDGEAYNKLRRPDGLLTSLTSQSPPSLEPPHTILSATSANKRKLEEATGSEFLSEDEPEQKRPREHEYSKPAPGLQKPSTNGQRLFRPVRECGMQSMFPGLDDEDSPDDATQEAIDYLRNVR